MDPMEKQMEKRSFGFLSLSEDPMGGPGDQHQGFSWLKSRLGQQTGINPSWIYNLWVGVNGLINKLIKPMPR